MKKLRRLSRNNVSQLTPEIAAKNTVILDETGGIVTTWEIEKDGHTLLITFPDTDTSKVFENIANHVENNNATLDYYGIDLYHTMFPAITEQQIKRTALTIAEAHELTATVVSEINERMVNGNIGNKIRIIIKDGDALFRLTDTEQPELCMGLLSNVQTILEQGAAVGITVFIEVDTDTAEQELNEHFTDVIILK